MIDRRLPVGDEIFLDHVGHFVSDREAASRAFVRCGFAPTPVSVQVNPDGSLTGTGNVCAMLPHGYIEVLFATAALVAVSPGAASPASPRIPSSPAAGRRLPGELDGGGEQNRHRCFENPFPRAHRVLRTLLRLIG